jgi:hypothetical protein
MDDLKACEVDSLAVMVNRANVREGDPLWRMTWTPKQLRDLKKLLDEYNIQLALEKWPRPDKDQIDLMMRELAPICKELLPAEVGDDCESNWNRRFLNKFRTMTDAADYLHQKNRELSEECGKYVVAGTTFAGHWELNPTTAIYFNMVDVIDAQLYAVRNRTINGTATQIETNHPRLGPGHMQRHALPRIKRIGPEVCCALALYDQRFPGLEPIDSFMKSFKAGREFGITKFAGWSSKWAIGNQARQHKITWPRQALTRIKKDDA